MAVTPDELGDTRRDGRAHRPPCVEINGRLFGRPDAGVDMTFDFPRLIAHVAETRELEAGSIIGSGTVSKRQDGLFGTSIENGGIGHWRIAEVHRYETIETGAAKTDQSKFADRVRIQMTNAAGGSIFGGHR